MSNNQIEAIRKKYEQQLLTYAGVTGVSTNHSRAIVIYVEKLTPQLTSFLPKTLDGIPVKIVQTGKFTILSMLSVPVVTQYADRVTKYRPAPGGVSVGSIEITAGTLACAALDLRTGKTVGLSNNHVCGPIYPGIEKGVSGTTPIVQPGVYDGGKDPADRIGILDRIIPVKAGEDNIIDAATFTTNQVLSEVAEIGKPKASIDPKEGMNVMKSGRSSGVTYGKVTDVSATIKVSGGSEEATFKDVCLVSPAILSPGDSGSWVGDQDTWQTVGLGFAGTTTVSAFCKALNVERLLNIQIIPPVRFISPTLLMGGWAAAGLGLVYMGRR